MILLSALFTWSWILFCFFVCFSLWGGGVNFFKAHKLLEKLCDWEMKSVKTNSSQSLGKSSRRDHRVPGPRLGVNHVLLALGTAGNILTQTCEVTGCGRWRPWAPPRPALHHCEISQPALGMPSAYPPTLECCRGKSKRRKANKACCCLTQMTLFRIICP